MGRDRWKTERSEDGNAKGRGEDIGARRRQSHTENKGDDHDKEERKKRNAARKGQDEADELDADAGQRNGGENDACCRAGDTDKRNVPHAAIDGVNDRFRSHTFVRLRQGDEPGERDPDRRRAHRRHSNKQEVDESNDRQKEIGLFQHLLLIGEVFGRESLESALHRLEAYHEEDRRVVDDRRRDRRDDDVDKGKAEEGGHQEGARTHNRRHYLPAGARYRLDRAREVRRVADLFHKGYRKGAGPVDVGDRRARDGAEEA